MSDLILFSTIALQGALTDSLLPTFGQGVTVTFDTTAGLATRVASGAQFDVIVATEALLLDQAATNVVTEPIPLVSVGISIAAAPNAPRPIIDTVEALKHALLNARSVAYSLNGASGMYFAKLIGELGIKASVDKRATVLPQGLTGEAILDGRADLAVQQTSELLAVRGIDLLGPLPAEVQQETRFSAALSARTDAPPATELVRHLTSQAASEVYASRGLNVLFGAI